MGYFASTVIAKFLTYFKRRCLRL